MKIGINRISEHPNSKGKVVTFTLDGKKYNAIEGETLASSLIANNIKIVARSFKYHRPRGLISLGSEEPNGLFRVGNGAKAEPNLVATQIEVYNGLYVESQNCWPSLKFDIGAINSYLSKLIPAGFYYKTFMWPSSMWEKYEWFIRRAAGLGKAAEIHNDPDKYEHMHSHADVLVAGGGLSGLISAYIAGQSGVRVIIADENPKFGGSLLAEKDIKLDGLKCAVWAEKISSAIKEMPNVISLTRSTVFGYHDHNFFTIVERCTDHLSTAPKHLPRQRLWKVRAKQIILAQGTHERPLIISGNDLPGVMLSSSVRGYINKFGVLPGKSAVIATNNDDAYRSAIIMHKANLKVLAVVDSRVDPNSEILKLVKKLGIKVLTGHIVSSIYGRNTVKSVEIAALTPDGKDTAAMPVKVQVDLVAVSGGWSPSVNLFSQSGGKLTWDEELGCFKPDKHKQDSIAIGGCNGTFDLEKCISESIKNTNEVLVRIGKKKNNKFKLPINSPKLNFSIRNLWIIPNGKVSSSSIKAFVDFQNDVTSNDVKLASLEGYNSVEHLKRYTTTGMATDQGKTSNINALGILSSVLNKPIEEVGTTSFRMPYTPTTFGAIGGRDIKHLFDPIRLTRIDSWHREKGAKFEHVGQWMRAWYYPKKHENMQESVNREVESTRNNAGILDASTLGKIDIRGPDAAEFLNRVYTNNWTNLGIGKCRYGIMLKDDGMVMDDGVTTRFANDHFHMTTTTGGAANVLGWLEEWLQTEWPNLKVYLTSVTEAWTVASISGPKARDIINSTDCDIDLSNENFEFMSYKEGFISGIPVKIFRVSFTGELSFEINTPSRFGLKLWEILIKSGEPFGLTPYGTESMHVLRAERGFIIVGQETDGSVSPVDLGMNWILSKKKSDFIGKRSLERLSMTSKNRKELVGLLTKEQKCVIPEGAHALSSPEIIPPVNILGHVTSSYYSPNCRRSIAMAMIKDGRSRKGQEVWLPLLDGSIIKAKVVDPIFFDPKGVRKNGI